jgi:hypothetical protein
METSRFAGMRRTGTADGWHQMGLVGCQCAGEGEVGLRRVTMAYAKISEIINRSKWPKCAKKPVT